MGKSGNGTQLSAMSKSEPEPELLTIKKLPTYSEIKQMVEATLKRSLLEPAQDTQSPDVIVFQNGVLHLTSDTETAFMHDSSAPVKYSHAIWSYFDPETWQEGLRRGLYALRDSSTPAEHFGGMAELVHEICPVFSNYMRQWFPADPAAVEVILRWFGYSMTTDTRQAKFMFFYGPTRAGKGSITRLLCSLVGSNNYAAPNYVAFEDKFQAIGMHDTLVVTVEEVEGTAKEHEKRMGVLKKYLGGERIVWEQKYQKGFEDKFLGKIVMQSNELLAYEDKGRAVTARMIPVEFSQSFIGEGTGLDYPETEILKAGEGRKIATLAAMAWYRMRRQRVVGAFEFNSSPWSIKHCNACYSGSSTMTIESHRVVFKYLEYHDPEAEKLYEFKERKQKGEIERLTKELLWNATVGILTEQGKSAYRAPGFKAALKKAIEREFPQTTEIQIRLKNGGRFRAWSGVYINVKTLENDYPDVISGKNE